MGLIICLACGCQKGLTPLKRGKYRCTNCGAADPRLVRGKAEKVWMDGEKAGVDIETARHRTYAGLKWYAENRGYKPGWAAVKFKKIFGQWPNGEAVEEAVVPQQGLYRWIKKQNASYAKERRANGDVYHRVPSRAGGHDAAGGAGGMASMLMNDDDWNTPL